LGEFFSVLEKTLRNILTPKLALFGKCPGFRQFLLDYRPTLDTAKLLAIALVLSHLDYANGILTGLPECSLNLLQYVQNWVATPAGGRKGGTDAA
jgi:hypothetical protein